MSLVIKRGFWLAVAVIVSLLWVEAFTRVLLPQSVDTVVNILQANPIIGFEYIPGSETQSRGRGHDVQIKINSLGFRNEEFEVEKGDAYRILLLGNSFSVSYGCEMEESLPASLQRALENEFASELNGKKIQVINVSNMGYRTFQYWRAYQRWVGILKPDLILTTIVPSEDYITFPEDTVYDVQDGVVVNRYLAGGIPNASKKSISFNWLSKSYFN